MDFSNKFNSLTCLKFCMIVKLIQKGVWSSILQDLLCPRSVLFPRYKETCRFNTTQFTTWDGVFDVLNGSKRV